MSADVGIHEHREAFCLMRYEPKDGSSVVWIWNSRDGVTPFGTTIDGVEHLHVRWAEDIYMPIYTPADDDWVWADVSRDLDWWRNHYRTMIEKNPDLAPLVGSERDGLVDHLAQTAMVEHGEQGVLCRITGAEYRMIDR